MIETIISALGSLTPEQITALGGVFLTLVFAALGIRAAPAIVRRTTNDGSTPTAATPDKDAVRQSLLIEQTHSGVQRIEMLLQKLL